MFENGQHCPLLDCRTVCYKGTEQMIKVLIILAPQTWIFVCFFFFFPTTLVHAQSSCLASLRQDYLSLITALP